MKKENKKEKWGYLYAIFNPNKELKKLSLISRIKLTYQFHKLVDLRKKMENL